MPDASPPLRTALALWFKIGCLGFGGPAGQIALLHEEVVSRRRWLSDAQFTHALNYCMLLPGPEAQQLATYIGWLLHRTWGGIAAGLLFILPGLLLLLLLAWGYLTWGDQPAIAALFDGLKPAVVAIVFHACWRIGRKVLKSPPLIALAAMALAAIALAEVPFPLIVLGAALCGWFGRHWLPSSAPALSPAAPTTAATARPWQVLASGLLLWLLPLLGLMALWGWQGTPAQMAWFFTKAALLTFGGAYAVLPYVQQAAVSHFGWLSAGQMMDGLALGETTPGPLILVVVFVGFVGGYQSGLAGIEAPALAGLIAGLVVAWYSFLPSFLFILVGAPLMERTQHLTALQGPLAAISAAIVGVIANLGLFFTLHTWWPQGWAGGTDLFALGLTLACAALLFSGRLGVVSVMALAAAGGLVRHLAG